MRHIRSLRIILALLAALLAAPAVARPAAAQGRPPESPAALLSDINQHTGDSAIGEGAMLGETLIYAQHSDQHGSELWRSDGTPAGTAMVADLRPGPADSQPRGFAAMGGAVYFLAHTDPYGTELWRSDGTAAGTRMVKDIRPGFGDISSDLTPQLAVVGEALYFAANDDAHGTEIWRSDGTAAGTRMVKDIRPGPDSSIPYQLTAAGSQLFFTAQASLWASDGTAEGTREIFTATPERFDGMIGSLTAVGERIFFTTGYISQGWESFLDFRLWTSDGTPQGTLMLRDFLPPELMPDAPRGVAPDIGGYPPALFFIRGLTAHQGALYLLVGSGELVVWRSDGTPGGTVELGLRGVSQIFSSGPALFFLTWTGLRSGDGTPGGSPILGPDNPYFLSRRAVGGLLYFTLSDGESGVELWRSDGTAAGTRMVKDIMPGEGSSFPEIIAGTSARLFFAARDEAHGHELWVSDGTAAGTRMVVDSGTQGASSSPRLLTVVGARAFFFIGGGDTPHELWVSDGTPAGARRVAALPEGKSPHGTWDVGGRLVFTLEPAYNQLWVSDGTPAGTFPLVDDEQLNVELIRPQLLGEQLIFQAVSAGSYGLWLTDGTRAGTRLIRETGGYPALAVAGDRAYFSTTTEAGCELWRSDGTAGGTGLVRRFARGGPQDLCSPLGNLTGAGSRLFFTLDDPYTYQRQLWVSDGTAEGTRALATTVPEWMTALGDDLIFFAGRGQEPEGLDLWVSDGTEAGTRAIREVGPRPDQLPVRDVEVVGGRIFFSVYDNSNGQSQLWASDGSAAGTGAVRTFSYAAYSDNSINDLTAVDDTLLFSAFEPGQGYELWRSDGTAAGTYAVQDLWPGPQGGAPSGFVRLGERILFAASDREHGRELWATRGEHFVSAPATVYVAPGAEARVELTLGQVGLRGRNPTELQLALPDGLSYTGGAGGPRPVVSGGSLSYSLPAPGGLLSRHQISLGLRAPAGAAYGTRYPVQVTLPTGEGEQRLTITVAVARQLYLPLLDR